MAETKTAGTEEQLVVFELTNEVYGVDIGLVQEIIRMTPITKLPKAPAFVEGVINLRGKVIPVMDLKKRFGLAGEAADRASRIVVFDTEGQTIGIVVDAVSEVLRVPAGAVEPPSPVATTVESDYVRGIAKLDARLIILLDLHKLFSWQEKQALLQVA